MGRGKGRSGWQSFAAKRQHKRDAGGKGLRVTCCSWGLMRDGTQQQQCVLHHSGAERWGIGAPATPIPMAGGGPCCPGAVGPGPGLGARSMLPDRAMMGTLSLPEGPELLDRKQRGERVLDSPESNLPPSPSHWLLLPAPSTLHPLGCLNWKPVSRALHGCIHIQSTIHKNGLWI
ncbi:unnamed protein product [Caretta caretta]